MAMEQQPDQNAVGEQMEEDCGGAMPIDALQAQGIAAADIKKLKEGNVYTVEALAHACKRELTSIKGLSEAKVEKMQKEGDAPCRVTSSCAFGVRHWLSAIPLPEFLGLCCACCGSSLVAKWSAPSTCCSLEDRAHGFHNRFNCCRTTW